ncbi:MAG TPA: YsnF/AvaK domain-containing protein, partial [Allosphingosinicella sp.]|nr:YsnF/AvaK domain-containing protein [Allosphingosinicella sp.]
DTGVPSGAGMGASGQGVVASDSFGSSGFGGSDTRSSRENIVEEEHVPIVEEQLRVGKREVERGGARVRSYVREVPVHEQVNLREEHVSVERRPVGERSAVAGLSGNNEDTFRDRTIEMTERSEEAVVAKEAQVREELVVKKTAEERTEQIDDNVRRTEVEVDENLRGSEDRSAFGGFGGTTDGSTSESRTDFERTDKDRF